MTWIKKPLIGFDLETTGLDQVKDRLVTAALVQWEQGTVRSEQKWLADPEIEISESASSVHGITNQYAQEHGEDFRKVVKDVHRELSAAVAKQIPIVIYNASFDFPMIENHFSDLGLPRLREQFDFVPIIDPLVLDRWQDRYRKGKRKLIDVANFYQVPVTEALHDCLADVRVTLRVLEKILTIYPAITDLSLPELYQVQSEAHKRWAQGLNDWLARQNSSRKPVSEVWIP